MVNFFGKSGKKTDVSIQVWVASVEAEPTQDCSMSIFFERGPQKSESLRFLMTKEDKHAEVNHLFNRTSQFVYDQKKKKWEDKTCTLSLGYHENSKYTKTGTLTLNLAEYIDKGEVHLPLKFDWVTGSILNARCQVTIKCDSAVEGQQVIAIAASMGNDTTKINNDIYVK